MGRRHGQFLHRHAQQCRQLVRGLLGRQVKRLRQAKLLIRQPERRALRDQEPPGRGAAFRHTVLEIYDYRCAACGIRVLLNQGLSLVEAAHLIPFGVSRNDKPTNGMALCPNHHWAMDRHLIAPVP